MKIQTVFETIADENRRKILELLKKDDLNVGQIAKHLSIGNSSLSHHLNKLKQSDLVVSERRGQAIVYSLNTSVFDEIALQIGKIFTAGG